MSLTLFVATHVIILASDHSTGSLTRRLHSKDSILQNLLTKAKEDKSYVTLRSATMHYVHPKLRLMA